MKPIEYRTLRTQIGTQQHVAHLLGVSVTTIAHREQGVHVVRREAELALERLRQIEQSHPTANVVRLKPQYGRGRKR